ncbi:MAG: Thrombospondin [Parcubacteria group bacterium GW2011_GWF2_44_8]|nr:MAG: Thrombospondin [Parcubacteria group bacterium GW2011_GWF2_44_8]
MTSSIIQLRRSFQVALAACLALLVPMLSLADMSQTQAFATQSEILVPTDLLKPTVIEIVVNSYASDDRTLMVWSSSTMASVPHYYKIDRQKVLVPISVSNEEENLAALTDNNEVTFVNFPLINGEETVTQLMIEAESSVRASGINVSLASNVIAPKSVKITALNKQSSPDDQVGSQVLYTGQLSTADGRIKFPTTSADVWLVEFTHTQPLRLTELSLAQEGRPTTERRTLRFLAQPDESYTLYANPNGPQSAVRQAYSLSAVKEVVIGTLSPKQPNPYYVESDKDNDGVVDRLDNCPTLSNSDQADIDGNKVGDTCDDWDVDGLINSVDNCPNLPNQNQRDEDGDGLGDVCDDEESRLTEKYPWISWLGLLMAAMAIGSMFWLVHTAPKPDMKKKEEEDTVV